MGAEHVEHCLNTACMYLDGGGAARGQLRSRVLPAGQVRPDGVENHQELAASQVILDGARLRRRKDRIGEKPH
jgi:hypothetical protein